SRADNGVLDTLARRLQQAERDAANALQQNPQRVPKDEVDTVVDENETVKDAVSGVDDIREALAGEGATTEDLQAQLEELNKQLQDQGEGGTEKLPLIQAYIFANTARWALQARVDEVQDEAAAELQAQQIAMKKEFEEDRANRSEKVIASAAGSSNPAHPVTNLPNGDWQLQLNGVAGTTLISDTWELAGDDRINPIAKQYTPTTDTFSVTRNSNQTMACEWVRTPGFVKSVKQDIYETYYLDSANTWYTLDDVHNVKIGASGTDNLDMRAQVAWPHSWGWYRLQIRAGDTVLADVRKEGTSTILSQNTVYTIANVSGAKIPPNTTVRAYVQRWSQASSSHHRYFRVITRASWTERNI